MSVKNKKTYYALFAIFVMGVLIFALPSIIENGFTSDTFRDVTRTIGLSFVVAPVSIAVTLYFSGANFDQKLDKILYNLPVFESHIDQFGITHIYKSRDKATIDFLKLCEHAEKIDIMGICIPQLIVEYEVFEKWASNKQIRILIMNEENALFPACIDWFFKQPEPEKEKTGKSNVIQFSRLIDFGGDVKKYESWPMASIMRADDILFYTPYVYKRRAQESPTFKVINNGESSLFSLYLKAFDRKFTESKGAENA